MEKNNSVTRIAYWKFEPVKNIGGQIYVNCHICSNCGEVDEHHGMASYCWNCGAKMGNTNSNE